MLNFVHKTENGERLEIDVLKSHVHVWKFDKNLKIKDDFIVRNIEDLQKFFVNF